MFITLSQLIELFHKICRKVIDSEGTVEIFSSYSLDSITSCKMLAGKI